MEVRRKGFGLVNGKAVRCRRNQVKVSIVIRTKNEEASIGRVLERIKAQKFAGDWEVIVVDSESTDSTLEEVGRYETRIVQIRQDDFSYGRALNVGAGQARGDIIVNLSAHALPINDRWLENLCAGFVDDSVAGVYGRQISDGNINPFEAYQNESLFGKGAEVFNKRCRARLPYVHFSNANSAIRREVWKRYRFDETVQYAEDYLWQTAVLDAGFSVRYTPRATVSHTHPVRVCSGFRNARRCSYAMALGGGKAKSVQFVPMDMAAFMGMAGLSFVGTLRYLVRRRYHKHLRIMPLFVFATSMGWLTGRVEYRLGG